MKDYIELAKEVAQKNPEVGWYLIMECIEHIKREREKSESKGGNS